MAIVVSSVLPSANVCVITMLVLARDAGPSVMAEDGADVLVVELAPMVLVIATDVADEGELVAPTVFVMETCVAEDEDEEALAMMVVKPLVPVVAARVEDPALGVAVAEMLAELLK